MVVNMSVFSNSGSSVYWNNPDSNFGFNNGGGYGSPLRYNNAFPLSTSYNSIDAGGLGSCLGYGGLTGGMGGGLAGGIGGGLGYGGVNGSMGVGNFGFLGVPFIGNGFLGY
jgi:hypothetical protein